MRHKDTGGHDRRGKWEKVSDVPTISPCAAGYPVMRDE